VSKGLRISLIVIGVVVAAAALLLIGLNLGRTYWTTGSLWPSSGGAYAYGGMMGSGAYGQGMMGGGMMGSGAYGPGMMGGGMMGSGAYGPGMMGGTSLYGVEPLTLEQAQEALNGYLAARGDDNLQLGELMIFDNHAYAEIVEADSGIGAMELLVDPVTLAVYPEHGPNMMWNLKYSPMASLGGYGMMGGMMGWRANASGLQSLEPSAEMPVSAAEAVEAAQRYLDLYLPGTVVAEEADPFYGYYTLHILRDGLTVGMLSVHGYSAQVFLHSWHGDFVEMAEE
jgi:hypothetical protein